MRDRRSESGGTRKAQFLKFADDIVVLVNRVRYDDKTQFVKGRNQIAVLASHRGRDKAFAYMGTLNDFHRKGIFGPVRLEIGGAKIDVKGWKMRGGPGTVDGDWPVVPPPTPDEIAET